MKMLMTAGVMAMVASAFAETPDFIADRITSDGVGYIDTGYANRRNGYPRTSRISVSFRTSTAGKGTAPGPVVEGTERTIFGYEYDSADKMLFRYGGDKAQVWYPGSGVNWGTGVKGDMTITLNEESGTATWSPAGDKTGISIPTVNSTYTYYLFAHHKKASGVSVAQDFAVFDLQSMSVYEKESEGAAEALAHHFLPCFLNGRIGLYDEETGDVRYPTTDGFVISGYDIDLASGKSLIVNSYDAAPRTLKLAAGSSLAFDGEATLSPSAVAELPEGGTVSISLTEARGKGRYVLIENLPADYELSSFVLSSVPAGNAGVLSKSGSDLVLTLTSAGAGLPDAIASTLTSDGIHFIDTGYKYVAGRTSRIAFDYATSNYGRKTGVTGDYRTLFGYQEEGSTSRWFMRYIPNNMGQLFYSDGYGTTASAVANGDVSVQVDYATPSVIWGGQEIASAVVPTADAAVSYYVFDNDYRGAGNGYPSAIDFKSMRIFEKEGAEPEVLACDLVPCVKTGRVGLYDRVAGEVRLPSSDTNGFSVAGVRWRLNAGGECSYVSGSVSVACAETVTPAGWVAVRDSDGTVIAKGADAVAVFTMPEAPVSVLWTHDAAVAAGETMSVGSRMGCGTLSLADGAVLSFAPEGTICLSGSLNLPETGKVIIAMPSVRAAGAYTVIAGAGSAVPLSAFVVGTLPEGLTGSIERYGADLVLRVEGVSDVEENRPEWLAETLTSDGVGYIDTGYKYRSSAFPKTSRIEFDFHTANYGKGVAPGPTTTGDPRTVFGYQSDNSGGRNIFRYSGTSKVQLWDGDTADRHEVSSGLNGDITVIADYLTPSATWAGNAFTGVTAPTSDSSCSYYIFAYHEGSITRFPSIIDFKGMRISEVESGGATTLVRDYVPCVKGGVAGVYDKVSGTVTYPSTAKQPFIAGGLHPAADVFGAAVQEFAHARTVSSSPVAAPSFAPERSYAFVMDGSISPKVSVDDVVIKRYDAQGALLASEDVGAVAAGAVIPVSLGGAVTAKVVFQGIGSSGETVVQSFAIADTVGTEPVRMRQVSKRGYEFLVSADVSFAFTQAIAEVVADSYDASGTLTGSERLGGPIAAGGMLVVPLGSAAYRIVRVTAVGPGLMLIFR